MVLYGMSRVPFLDNRALKGNTAVIRLNRMTDYAVVVLGMLNINGRRHGFSPMSASEIASRTGISQPATAKIMKLLAQAGLVEATRGKDGGYALARDGGSISIAEIIEALEGPIALTACVEGASDPCASRHHCFISGNWQKVNAAISGALHDVTLAELVDPDHMFEPLDATPSADNLNVKGVL